MICPKCGAEYQPGFRRCADCLVDLVGPGALPEATPEPSDRGPAALTDPVCVYRSTQRARLPLAESLLRSAGVPFVAAGEHVQQLTGLDVFGPAELYVSAADADDARAVLAGDADDAHVVWTTPSRTVSSAGARDVGGRALGFGVAGLLVSLLLHGALVFWVGPALALVGLYYGVSSLTASPAAAQSRDKAWVGIVCAAIGLLLGVLYTVLVFSAEPY